MPKLKPRKTAQTAAFPLNWGASPADMLDLQANLIEAAGFVTRHFHHGLSAQHTLAGLTAWMPTYAKKPLAEMSAADLVVLISRLRRSADLIRERESNPTTIANDEAAAVSGANTAML